jgi:hypothetical protein
MYIDIDIYIYREEKKSEEKARSIDEEKEDSWLDTTMKTLNFVHVKNMSLYDDRRDGRIYIYIYIYSQV